MGADGLGVGTVSAGLRPPAPSSVEPIGIPTRPVDTEPIAVGDEADAAGVVEEALPIEGQVPDAFPVRPPPSNTVVEVGVPADETPVPNEVPAREFPVLYVVSAADVPIPDDVPMAEVARPNDDCAIEPPKPLHVAMAPVVVGGAGDVPDVNGLRPGVCISVAPRGIRTGGTGEPEPTPSGDVMPSGGSPGETCAKAGPQPRSTAAVAAITKRVIRLTFVFAVEFVVRCRHTD
jgi:hypothetical protein